MAMCARILQRFVLMHAFSDWTSTILRLCVGCGLAAATWQLLSAEVTDLWSRVAGADTMFKLTGPRCAGPPHGPLLLQRVPVGNDGDDS